MNAFTPLHLSLDYSHSHMLLECIHIWLSFNFSRHFYAFIRDSDNRDMTGNEGENRGNGMQQRSPVWLKSGRMPFIVGILISNPQGCHNWLLISDNDPHRPRGMKWLCVNGIYDWPYFTEPCILASHHSYLKVGTWKCSTKTIQALRFKQKRSRTLHISNRPTVPDCVAVTCNVWFTLLMIQKATPLTSATLMTTSHGYSSAKLLPWLHHIKLL